MQKLKAATYCPVSSDPEDQERRKVYYGKYMQKVNPAADNKVLQLFSVSDI